MAAPAAVRAHVLDLDVTGPQGTFGVQHAALDEGGVPEQVGALPHQRVHAAKGVLPVRVVQAAVEGLDEQGVRRVQDGAVQAAWCGP